MILRGSQRLKGPHFLFALHLISGGILDVCGRVDLFFWSSLDLGDFCGSTTTNCLTQGIRDFISRIAKKSGFDKALNISV